MAMDRRLCRLPGWRRNGAGVLMILWLVVGIGLVGFGVVLGLVGKAFIDVGLVKRGREITIQLAGLTGAPTSERYRFKMGYNDKDLDQTEYEIVGYDPVGSGTNPKAMDVYFEQVKEVKPKIALGPPPPPPDE